MPSAERAVNDLDAMAAESIAGMIAAIRRVAAVAGPASSPFELTAATEALAAEMTDMMTLANLSGRARTIRAARAVASEAVDAALVHPDLSPIPQPPTRGMKRSARALLNKEPALARSAAEVPALVERGAFTLARGATEATVRRVQKVLVRSLNEGEPTATTARILADTENWTSSYAENVVRTNQARAYDEGAEQMALDPAIADVTPAFRFDATRDTHTRPNHRAAHGFIAAVGDPEWEGYRPPLGFGCRCVRSLVTRSQLRRMGLIDESGAVIKHYPRGFANAGADPGFIAGGNR